MTVERCYFHEPRGRANSWYYSHPAGPEGVMMAHAAGSTVIRWNDFIGSDDHRWNDAVEGRGNFSHDGGFNRTGDVYGNFMTYCNDDCVEMDGGQRNVRNFDNRYEGALCGVSVQGCMVGPSYVYRNLFSGMCGEFGEAGQTLKVGGGQHGPDAEVFSEKNVFWGKGTGVMMLTNLTLVSSGNVFCGKQKIGQIRYLKWPTTNSSTEGDVTKEIEERDLDAAYPIRPMSLMLDGARFSGFKVKGGACEPSALTVRVRSKGRASRFRIVKNDEFGWLRVSPAEGEVPADGEVTLEYNEGAEFPGLNLVGNPLADDAYIGRGYYRMNRDTREGLIPAGADESIDAMEGIFVIAEEDGETMTFSTTPTFKLRTKLILNLQSSSATLIDRAIVNFENSQELPKIEILSRNSKIYFQKESHDLATLNAGDMGEIPVCFKAVKNGNYTLSFKSEEVTFTYLHLIDNKTGNDVNLLETPYYSFDATTSDYESRFRLVFATGSSVDGGNFGFVNSSGNFCIFGIEGEATVQVVDILGHMLSSETFSGSYEKKLNVAPGVYMLRLIQGKDVKVQKTVIK